MTVSTSAAVATARAGRSHRGSRVATTGSFLCLRNTYCTPCSARMAATSATQAGTGICASPRSVSSTPAQAIDIVAHHGTRSTATMSARANTARATLAAVAEVAAWAAKVPPCSRAMISRMGPATIGMVTRIPPSRGPHRRAASDDSTTSAGASSSFNAKSTSVV